MVKGGKRRTKDLQSMYPYDPSNPITSPNIVLYIGKYRLEIRIKKKKKTKMMEIYFRKNFVD